MRSRNAVRICLVDDHAVVRAGYRRFLEQESDFEVIAEAGSGEEAYLLLQSLTPDVVILDLNMPGRGAYRRCGG
jgi:two-component system invasion response regulator UvrY